jgi:hypothetical protein
MSDHDHNNDLLVVVELVDDPVVANSYSPGFTAGELTAALGTW